MNFWLVSDRRVTEKEILKDVRCGDLEYSYSTLQSAERAMYPTERIWRITVDAKPEKT